MLAEITGDRERGTSIFLCDFPVRMAFSGIRLEINLQTDAGDARFGSVGAWLPLPSRRAQELLPCQALRVCLPALFKVTARTIIAVLYRVFRYSEQLLNQRLVGGEIREISQQALSREGRPIYCFPARDQREGVDHLRR
jgi:hypothetical protein